MFKNSYQSGLLSIFYSCGAHPLALWDMEVNNGHIKRLTDKDVNSIVLEIVSTNVATTYIKCPRNNQCLGIKLPFLVMIVKNLKRYFSFEITILDDKNLRRRFRISNFQSTTKIKPFCTTMPIGLSGGWNQIQFNLSDFTRRAYGTQFIEALRVQVHANVRLRRIYFAERLYSEEELPQEYKLYLPLEKKQKKGKDKDAPTDAKPVGKPTDAKPVEAAPVPAPTPPPIETVEVPPTEDKSSVTPVSADADKPSEVAPSAPDSTPAETPGDTPLETPREEAKEEEPQGEDAGPGEGSEAPVPTEETAEPVEQEPEE